MLGCGWVDEVPLWQPLGVRRSPEVVEKEEAALSGLCHCPVLLSGPGLCPELLEHAGNTWREVAYFPGLKPCELRPCCQSHPPSLLHS